RLARLAPRVPGLSAKIADGVTPALCSSAFVHRGVLGYRTVGTLCPNAVLDTMGTRVDDVATPGRFLVVTTVEPTDGQREEIERRAGVVRLARAVPALARWLTKGHATAAIVRPDRTVLCAGRSLASLYTRLPALPRRVAGT